MKPVFPQRILALLLALSLLCTACSETKATTMSLLKTEGDVEVHNDQGKSVTPAEHLKLYSGYDMLTQAVSFAWIDLDSVKLVKMDEDSEIKILKDGDSLDILLKRGSLFFHVSQPLADDESMNIRTSTMAVGIRGTCGWVTADGNDHAQVYILEGAVTSTDATTSEVTDVAAGQMADLTLSGGAASITVSSFQVQDIPAYVMVELLADDDLSQAILDASGLDVHNPFAVQEAAQRAYDEVIAEYVNFYDDAHAQLGTGFTSAQWMNSYYNAYRTAYPHINPTFLEHYTGHEALYSTYCDLDGNGVNELLIGMKSSPADTQIQLTGVYLFDRTEAVLADVSQSVVLADGLIAACGSGGEITAVSQIGGDGYTLEPAADTDLVLGSDAAAQDFAAHGGRLEDQLGWIRLTEGSVDFSAYLGNYVCDRTGTTLWLEPGDGPERYILYASRLGDPMHSDSYDLTVNAAALQVVSWQTGDTVLTVTPQDGGLTVTSLDSSLSYLSGEYHRMGSNSLI